MIDALAAAIIVFVTELAQAIFTPHPEHSRRRIHHAIRRAERAIELMLLLMAFRLATPPAQRLSTFARRNTPNGFTRRVRRSKLLFKHACVRLRHGAFHQRLARLIAAIAQPTRYVQRFLKRLHKGLRGSSLVATRPVAHALFADVPATTCYADSS
ncbi:MAG: hypothetical protein ACK4X1_17645 [Terricaulis sp.]